MESCRVVVQGAVQGVGVRWSCATQARGLGVRGWVRNRSDGAVEVAAEGDADAVAALVAWLQHGPRYADVRSVAVSETPAQGWSGFEVEP